MASWVTNAKSLQEDIIRSKAIANDIIRQSETPDVSGKTIQDAEAKVEFLSREVQYAQQLDEALKGVRHVNHLLSEAEQASNERRILDSLRFLEGTACVSGVASMKLTGRGSLESWSAMDALPVGRTCRAVRLLDVRSFELKSGVHEVLNQVWKRLVQVDIDSGTIAIQDGNGGKCYQG